MFSIVKFYFPFPFSDKIFCDIQHVMNRRDIIVGSRTVRLIRTPAALIYHAVLCCIFAVSLSIIHETQIPFTFFQDFLKKFSGEITPPSSLRDATAPNRGGLGKEVGLYAMPRAPLLAGAVTAGDWGVVQRSSCRTKPHRHPFGMPPPLIGAALAKRLGFTPCQGPPY